MEIEPPQVRHHVQCKRPQRWRQSRWDLRNVEIQLRITRYAMDLLRNQGWVNTTMEAAELATHHAQFHSRLSTAVLEPGIFLAG